MNFQQEIYNKIYLGVCKTEGKPDHECSDKEFNVNKFVNENSGNLEHVEEPSGGKRKSKKSSKSKKVKKTRKRKPKKTTRKKKN